MKILLLAVVVLIILILFKFLIVPIYRAIRKDSDEIKKGFKKVEEELTNKNKK